MGSHVAAGVALVNGTGVQVAYINAQDFFTRELSVQADLGSRFNPGVDRNQLVFAFGGALRVFGFERTIGTVGYRGYDIDVGFRIGPGFSFSTRESRADRNRRFNLVMEPYIRISARTGFVHAVYLEAGTSRPHIRFGFWLQL